MVGDLGVSKGVTRGVGSLSSGFTWGMGFGSGGVTWVVRVLSRVIFGMDGSVMGVGWLILAGVGVVGLFIGY